MVYVCVCGGGGGGGGGGGTCHLLVSDPWILGQGPANGMTTVLTSQSVPCSSQMIRNCRV